MLKLRCFQRVLSEWPFKIMHRDTRFHTDEGEVRDLSRAVAMYLVVGLL